MPAADWCRVAGLVSLLFAAPAFGQQTEWGPIRQSIEYESTRLLKDEGFGRSAENPPQGDWTRVRALPSAMPVTLTVRGGAPVKRLIVAVDERGLIVLNLNHPLLPIGVRDRLFTILMGAPAQLVSGTADIPLASDTLLTREGLFVQEHRVLLRAELIERIERQDLQELRDDHHSVSSWGRGLLIGAGGGALIAYIVGSHCPPGVADCGFSGIVFSPVGAFFGALVGAAVGASVQRETSIVLYHSP
jgi:hypothetical protein